ncbi:U32 family peptidase [Massilibacteroides sp.]|uniref:peptidase U32 family protein n=1 Tax=Massilibacteroides sp. TaxID=2034766 RepID=UPI00261C7755|nr:U32 family peptidase [Massilibacteroides sp.]MDD4516400.1 U32 family peptidase [Massilibacteroides sp.]
MEKVRPIELLAPAKDLTCGIEAINHGADAVYIGSPRFGARAMAGNSIEDISTLCEYAHRFNARIYVALNTLLYEHELENARMLVWDLYRAGADALIVQDMGLLELDLPPIPLHASTQTDNRTIDKVRFLESAGFDQVVLARELSLNEIRAIHEATNVHLEVFVHGALCVSYSGQCYLSHALSGRSANRGECAQYCRLPYTMIDANGVEIVSESHLLSLKDMNRSDQLEALLDAGVSSFKIEGRLKDVAYVKNITAYYRKKLDAILNRRPEYIRSSVGKSSYTFEPVPEKSFNRGFTNYFLNGRTSDITSFDSPKSKGELIGVVKEIKGNSFTVAGVKQLNNGDGLVFINSRGELEGFRVNRVEANRVFPLNMPAIKPKMQLYRNYDHSFEQEMNKPTAERKINVDIEFSDNMFGFTLSMTDETGIGAIISEPFLKEPARKSQEYNIRAQLSKLGNSPFDVSDIRICFDKDWFVPSSLLAEMRRKAVEKLLENRRISYPKEYAKRKPASASLSFPEKQLTYLGNVLNSKAESFYYARGVKTIEPAFEAAVRKDVPLMFTKHCLRYSMGWCPVWQKGKSPYKEPFYLTYKETKLRLQFDCKACQMLIFATM